MQGLTHLLAHSRYKEAQHMCNGCDRPLLLLGVYHLEAILGKWLARLWYHFDDVKDEDLHKELRGVRIQKHARD
jgi:hypothetical protein